MYGKEFLKAADLETILGIGHTRALDIIHMFIQSGRGFSHGWVYRVRSEIFNEWHSPDVLPTRQFSVVKGGDEGENPIRREFLQMSDIARILDISIPKAQEIMHELVAAGRAIKYGRIYRVKETTFYDWMSEFDGYKPDRMLKAV